jgi:hypothetical protein
VILVAYGAGRVSALSAAVTFRVVNFWLPIVIGWLAVGLIAIRSGRPGQPAAGPAADPDLRAIAAVPPD